MEKRIQTTALSRRIIILGIPVTMMTMASYMIALAAIGEVRSPLFYFGPASVFIAAPIFIWLELRVPRYVLFKEGSMTLESRFGSQTVYDGDVISLGPSFWQSVPQFAGPVQLVLRYKGGRRRMYGDFIGFAEFVNEVRRRNPKAQITVEAPASGTPL